MHLYTGGLKTDIESEAVKVDIYGNNIKIKREEAKCLLSEVKDFVSEAEKPEWLGVTQSQYYSKDQNVN